MSNIQDVIAMAIKKADNTMFNENYSKQAAAVLQAVQKAGYEIVPIKPPEGLLPYVHDNMPFGRLRPHELVTQLYTLMVSNVRRFDK